VLDLIEAGGWMMLPILLCSVIAMAIIGERLWALRRQRVLPPALVNTLRAWARLGRIPDVNLDKIAANSPLGRIVAAGLLNRYYGRDIVKESIEDTGRQVVHELERFLNVLGTIAAITPLLGLLGTVLGMIRIFDVFSLHGGGDAQLMAGGIAEALITTASGISVAIPSLFFYRFLTGRVDELVVNMEVEALRLVDIIYSSALREAAAV
jgi:biopolymer transport protein ExbB